MTRDQRGTDSGFGLSRLLFGRRVLNQQVTSAALLAGVLVGLILGAVLGAWLAGVWIGALLGIVIPRVIAVGWDATGRLPAWALYKARPR